MSRICLSFSRLIQRNYRPLQYAIQRNTFRRTGTNINADAKEKEELNEPVQFFGSEAATWRAKDTRSGGSDDDLWYQPYVISGSLAIFLLYFCVLREESDIDRKLEGSVFEKVDGLEEMSLAVNYNYNKEHGLPTKELEERLTTLGVNVPELEKDRLKASTK